MTALTVTVAITPAVVLAAEPADTLLDAIVRVGELVELYHGTVYGPEFVRLINAADRMVPGSTLEVGGLVLGIRNDLVATIPAPTCH